jgi:hypothetical protein
LRLNSLRDFTVIEVKINVTDITAIKAIIA